MGDREFIDSNARVSERAERIIGIIQQRQREIEEIYPKENVSPASLSPRTPLNLARSTESKRIEKEASPSKMAALESTKAKQIAQQLEQKITDGQLSAPVPKARHHQVLRPLTPHDESLLAGAGVVQGARADEKTPVPSASGNLKSLRSRWEFSSSTGTPLHPDASEDALLAAARRAKEAMSVRRAAGRVASVALPVSSTSPPQAKGARLEHAESMCSNMDSIVQQTSEVGSMNSPTISSADVSNDVYDKERHGSEETEGKEEEKKSEEATVDVEDIVLTEDDDEGDDDVEGGSHDDNSDTASRIINRAFDFIDPLSAANTPSPTKAPRANIEEDGEAPKSGSRMPYSVSFYRKIRRERTSAVTPNTTLEPRTPQPNSLMTSFSIRRGSGEDGESEDVEIAEDAAAIKKRFLRDIQVEDERISQSKRALSTLCRQKPEFRGSREDVEIQRILLIATQKRRALATELERLEKDGPKKNVGPIGEVTLTQLNVSLSREYVQTQLSANTQNDVYYFVGLLKCDEQVEATKLVVSDDAIRKNGIIEFKVPLHLKNLTPDFVAELDIYGQRMRRETASHEEKYGLMKGSTLKGKDRKSTLSKAPMFYSSADSAFCVLGSMSMDMSFGGGKKSLSHAVHPIDGAVAIKIKKRTTGACDAEYKGFLSMYQRTREGLGSWSRYWCLLSRGEMRFWRHPEDVENEKAWLVLLDLATCVSAEGASTVFDVCPYPNSFHVDVWVPKEETTTPAEGAAKQARNIEKLRVMLAADTPNDLATWLGAINSSTRQVCTWRNPIG